MHRHRAPRYARTGHPPSHLPVMEWTETDSIDQTAHPCRPAPRRHYLCPAPSLCFVCPGRVPGTREVKYLKASPAASRNFSISSLCNRLHAKSAFILTPRRSPYAPQASPSADHTLERWLRIALVFLHGEFPSPPSSIITVRAQVTCLHFLRQLRKAEHD
jgi:hypothetical protein